jgi:hypothetical protein
MTSNSQKKVRQEIVRYIRQYIGADDSLVDFLADMLIGMRVHQLRELIVKLDSTIYHSTKRQIKYKKSPVSKWVFNAQLKIAKEMELDRAIITTLYVARRRCELGRQKTNTLCRLLFRDGSSLTGVNTLTGKIRFATFKYGWDLDGSNNPTKIGMILPRFSSSKKKDDIARAFIKCRAEVFPDVLKQEDLEDMLGKSIPEGRWVTVIDVKKAVELLVKLVVEVCWRDFTWLLDASGNGEVQYGTFHLLVGIEICG